MQHSAGRWRTAPGHAIGRPMIEVVDIFVFAALGLVVLALIAGLINLMFSGEKARSRSNQLMRLRVAAQFIAVIALMVGFWLKSRASS